MIPFPGESIGLIDAAKVVAGVGDFDLRYSVTFRGANPGHTVGSATLAAGDEWRGWALGYGSYQESDTIDAEFAWVIEVLSGSVTFTASEGLDPDYGNPTAAHPVALGTFTAGPGTTVIPSTFTVAQGWADTEAFMLVVQATSGSAVVQQVKLRVWPTAGIAGGWSDLKPEWANDWGGPVIRHHGFDALGTFTSGAVITSWEVAWASAALDERPEGPHEFGPDAHSAHSFAAQGRPNFDDYFTSVAVRADLALIEGKDWTTYLGIDEGAYTEGVDWIRPPTEVDGDRGYYVQQVGDGGVQWRNAFAAVWIGADDHPLGGIHLNSEAYAELVTAPGSLPGNLIADVDLLAGQTVATAGSDADFSSETPIATGGRWLAVSITHSSLLETGEVPGWPGTSPSLIAGVVHNCQATVEFSRFGNPIESRALFPRYRYWAPVVARIPLRQLHRDDGLGGTPPRAFGGASRIRTGRAYGYD